MSSKQRCSKIMNNKKISKMIKKKIIFQMNKKSQNKIKMKF